MTTMVAYAVFIRDRLRDPDTMQTYLDEVGATFEGRQATRRAGHGPFEVLEGAAMESVVITEFPSIEAARAWYDSAAYREVRRLRHLAADYRAFIVEGV
jgi:uncharacterized protein (DUF1330 family)